MPDKDGQGFGYFVALSVLIAGVPTILLLAGIYRKRYTKRFEARLGDDALQSARDMRRAFVLNHMEERKASLKGQASQMLRLEATSADADFEEQSLRVFQDGMLQGHVYWGISDFVLPNGSIVDRAECAFSLKPGLFEDFLFTAFNQTNPLPLMFGDDRNPESMFTRFVVYCTAQAFALLLFLYFHDSYTVISILMSPLIVLCEHWLRLMLFCPCLTRSDIFLEDAEADEKDDNQKLRRVSFQAAKASLRCIGALLSLPLLLVLLLLLIGTSILLTSRELNGLYLAEYLWTGIVSPFLIKLVFLVCRYLTFIYPTSFSICGFNVLKVNFWTQSKKNDVRLENLSRMTEDIRLLEEVSEKQKLISAVDTCYATCFCCKCSELKHRHHNRLDCMQPSVYVRDSNICCSSCDQYHKFLVDTEYCETDQEKNGRFVVMTPLRAEQRAEISELDLAVESSPPPPPPPPLPPTGEELST